MLRDTTTQPGIEPANVVLYASRYNIHICILYIENPVVSGEVPLHSTQRMQVEAVDVSSDQCQCPGEITFIEEDIVNKSSS